MRSVITCTVFRETRIYSLFRLSAPVFTGWRPESKHLYGSMRYFGHGPRPSLGRRINLRFFSVSLALLGCAPQPECRIVISPERATTPFDAGPNQSLMLRAQVDAGNAASSNTRDVNHSLDSKQIPNSKSPADYLRQSTDAIGKPHLARAHYNLTDGLLAAFQSISGERILLRARWLANGAVNPEVAHRNSVTGDIDLLMGRSKQLDARTKKRATVFEVASNHTLLTPSTTLRATRSLALLLGALAGLVGCAGTVVVDFAIEAKVNRRDAAGRPVAQRPQEISILPRPAGLLSPFSAVHYETEVLAWAFGTGTDGFGGGVRNLTTGPMCFRFDEAKLASNLYPAEIALSVSVVAHTLSGGWTVLGSTDPKKLRYFAPPSLCFAPNKSVSLTIGPDLSVLFPNLTMFNVKWPDGEPNLNERGIGNWLKIVVPIEYDGKREILEVRLTATDSKARLSNY